MERLLNQSTASPNTKYGSTKITRAYEGGEGREMVVGVPVTRGSEQVAQDRRNDQEVEGEQVADVPRDRNLAEGRRQQDACCTTSLVCSFCTNNKTCCFCSCVLALLVTMVLATLLVVLTIAWGVLKNSNTLYAVSGEEVFDFPATKHYLLNKEVCIEMKHNQANIELYLLETVSKDVAQFTTRREISGTTDAVYKEADLYFYWLSGTQLTIDVNVDSNANGYVRLISDRDHKLGENCAQPKNNNEEWYLGVGSENATCIKNDPDLHCTITHNISVDAHYHLCFRVLDSAKPLRYNVSLDCNNFDTENATTTHCNPDCCAELKAGSHLFSQTIITANDSEIPNLLSVPYYLDVTYSEPRFEVLGYLVGGIGLLSLCVLVCFCYATLLGYKRCHNDANCIVAIRAYS